MSLEFSDRLLHGCVIVEVRGEVDFGSAPVMDQRLSAILGVQAPTVVLDLSRLTFVDCAALRVLAAVEERAAAHGTTIVLAAARPRVARILQITGLDRQLAVFPTVAKAVTAGRRGRTGTRAGQMDV
jgi:anti-sigma B factor antagonist